MKKKVIVTGGLGFIGSNLIELLLNKISHYKKENDTNSMYKNAIIICQKLSGQRKSQKNPKI